MEIIESFLNKPKTPEDKGIINGLLGAPEQAPGASPVNVEVSPRAEEKLEQNKPGKSLMSKASGGKKTTDKVIDAIGAPKLEDIPTPPSGGVGLLLFISLVIVFAITPVPGMGTTRLKLLWGAALGNFSLNSNQGKGGGGGNANSSGGGNSSAPPGLNPPGDPMNQWGVHGGGMA